MIIRAKKIIGNKAITQSGHYLGRVVDFEINTNSQNIIKYYIQDELLGFLKKPLIISAEQVIEIRKDEIIVEDAVIKEKIAKKSATSDIEYAK